MIMVFGLLEQAAGESFQTVQTAANGQVLRGVSFTPGTGTSGH